MTISIISKKTLRLAVLAAIVAPAMPALATPVELSNGYVRAGVSDYGTLGSNSNASPGILFDKTGTGSYGVNDFLTPGSPFEGFYVTTASGTGNGGSNNAGGANFGFTSPTSLSTTSATWSGSNSVFSIVNNYNLTTLGGQSVIAIETFLTNITTAAINGVNFLRTLDPDPDVNAFGSHYTENTVLSDNQAGGTGISSGQTIFIYSFDSIAHKAGVSAPWSTNPGTYLAGVNDGNGDYAIGVGFNIGDILAGQTIKLTYGYSLGATKEIAGGGNVPEPASVALLGMGILSFAARRRKTA
ncbi:MAG: PEP-CTERM sorting domain-containing protein [Methylococcaceae bacterium]|nr:PEP-CTERM sorting domain-containing protein [Methylococcaceae bacterium]MDP3902425.1 PEP-CTERM sorting domain-containing protein [Methylococcaceae bacterium]